MENGILDGVRILDLAEGLAGSVAALILAEAGADVVKIEPPGGGPLRGKPPFHVWNRSKRGVAMDVTGADRARFEDLVRSADVLIHDLAPTAAAARGLDEARLKALAPGLIVCAVTGFPAGHDEQETPAIDTLVLAASGVMDEQGPVARADGPVYLRFPLGSWGAAWLAAIGVATRLYNLRRGGGPGAVGTSLLQGALVPMMMHWRRLEAPSDALVEGMTKDTKATIAECADGVWIHMMRDPEIAPLMQAELARMSPAAREAANTARPSRWPNWGACFAAFKARPSAEWLAALWACDVPVQPALPMGALYYDAQCQANGYVLDVEDPELGATRQPGAPYAVTPPARVRSPAPCLNADRAAVLAEWTPRPSPAVTRTFRRPLEGIKVPPRADADGRPGRRGDQAGGRHRRRDALGRIRLLRLPAQ
jgi:crotonobetainyl-CoA:carnitine CoA-transferase CaiB-like acyl-CoA transferase